MGLVAYSQLYRLRDSVTLRGEHAGFNPLDDLVIVVMVSECVCVCVSG